MPLRFERDGISFQYPENWQLVPEEYEAGWSVTVQSPGTAFLIVTFDEEAQSAALLADAAADAIKSEYQQVDADSFTGTISGLPAVGYDVEFISLDLTNSCLIRAFAAGAGSVVIIGQASDAEPYAFEVVNAMCASIRVDEDA